MKNNLFRIISFYMVLVMVLALLTACGSSGSKETTPTSTNVGTIAPAATAAPLAEYTIRALFPGDTPNDMDLVIAQAENELRDALNVKLDFQFIPWADYGNKIMVKLAAGDDFDLHLNAPWLSINQLITANEIQPLDDLLAKDAPDVLKAFPKAMIDDNKFLGKIYGIPLGNTMAAGKNGRYLIRGDLREKYGLAPIKSFDELEQYFLKVKENEKGMVPLTWNASQFAFISSTDSNTYAFGQNNASVMVPFNDDGSITLENMKPIYEYPGFINTVKMMNKWYNEGIIDKDALVQKDGKGAMLSGKTACSNIDFIDEAKLVAAVPGAKVEATDVFPSAKPISDFKMWNFLCLNSASKDPDRVMKFYNWIFADQAHYDLLQYGIKDRHWVDSGKGTYDLPANVDVNRNYNFPGYVLLWNPNFDRVAAKSSQGYKDENAFQKNPDNYVQSVLTGFNPNYDGLKNEIAKVGAIWPQTILALTSGMLDPDKGLASAKKQLEAAGYLKIVNEAKKQIGDFIAANKK